MVSAVLSASVGLDHPSALSRFLQFISPLILDNPDEPSRDDEDEDQSKAGTGAGDGFFASSSSSNAFALEQESVSKLIHLIYNEDTDTNFALLCIAREKLSEGKTPSKEEERGQAL